MIACVRRGCVDVAGGGGVRWGATRQKKNERLL